MNNFIDGEILYESKRSKVFRATNSLNNEKVVIKQLNKRYPTNEDIENFYQEYEVVKSLNSLEGIGYYKHEQVGSTFYLIMDDFEGYSLNVAIKENKLNFASALRIAVKIADALCRIHQHNVIHKDINPSNILWNDKTDEIRIIDYGISCHLSSDINEIYSPDNFDGTIPYISPEQTGRMNLATDYRTDMYSLGITLYQLFTKRLPFTGNDAIELVHCHLAKTPSPLFDIDPDIPRVLSDIVMKLIEKDPDKRYQSVLGLKLDLEKCLNEYLFSKKIEDFDIAQNDSSNRFLIPQRLYGMENEIDILQKTLNRACNGNSELVLVTGYADIGMNALVNALHKTSLQNSSHLIKGKFDRFKKDVPLHAIQQAFSELLIEILSFNAEILAEWKNNFINTLGPNGKIITDIIPGMDQLIGTQPEIQTLSPDESQNRFLMIFKKFIEVIANKAHPLILLLDDIQWSDPLSIELIKYLGSTKIPYFMFICAYRSNEVSQGHIINLTFNEISKARNYTTLTIPNLSPNSVKQLVSETLHQSIEKTSELSSIIYKKTGGNPFLIREILKSLHREDLIKYNVINNSWKWDLEKIKKISISDNLYDILKLRIKKLPGHSINALKVASCIGNTFDLKTISEILNKKPSDVSDSLLLALDEGIIFARGNRIMVDTYNNNNQVNISYTFHHSRIQQVVYGLMNRELLEEIHYRIGLFYKANLSEEVFSDRIIEIATHFNNGLAMVLDEKDKMDLAVINSRAAYKALSSAAFKSALTFYEKGISLLPQESWDLHYELTKELYKGYTTCAYKEGYFEQADKYLDFALENLTTEVDKASFLSVRLRHYVTMGKPKEAIEIGKQGLKMLGVRLSPNPGFIALIKEILKAKIFRKKRNNEDLVELPVLTDSKKRLIARLYSEMGAPAYTLGNDILYGVLAMKVVNLSFKHGYTPELPYALVAYGMLQSIAFGNLKAGNELGNLAIKLNDKHNDIEYKCRVIAAYGVLTHHWNHHWSSLSDIYRKGIEAGTHSGDIFYLAHCANNCVIWNPKLNLQTLADEHSKYLDLIRETKFADALDTAQMRMQVILNLMGKTKDRFSLSDESFNEAKHLEEMKNRKYVSGIAMYHIAKAEIYLLFGKPCKAYEHIAEARLLEKSLVGLNYTLILSVTAFHSSSQCLDAKDTGAPERKKLLKVMHNEIKQMKKWASHNPNNYLHHLLIMRAELARHSQKFKMASQLYTEAIENANKNSWFKDEAFFYEITSRFFGSNNIRIATIGYIKHAHYLYKRIGAAAKADHLIEAYPELENKLNGEDPYATANFNITNTSHTSMAFHSKSTRATSIGLLDMNTITKATQTISGEIVFETLLEKLLQITVENAGAQQGFIVLKNRGEWIIQAKYSVEDNLFTLLQDASLSDSNELPHSIINYVINSGKSVVLADAQHEGLFTQDPYILSKKPKSIFSLPIIKQSQLRGILYLENNFNVGVFSKHRQQLLNILSTQIAISIENARLYEGLEEKIKERTAELIDANNQLSDKNNQIQAQKEELEKLNTSKDKLFSIIGHDLKSPFNAILGVTDLLASKTNEYTKDEIIEFAEGINQAGKKVYNLLDNLLNWAMSQSGKILFKPAVVKLSDIVSDVKDITEKSSKEKNISVRTDIDSSLTVYADKHMLYTILRNLVNNSIKYCYKNGNIKIYAYSDEENIVVSVDDDGIGIEKELLGSIFDISKKKSSKPGTNKETGTGLGLILCKEFVEKHCGKIWVESEAGNGCNFKFSLPIIR